MNTSSQTGFLKSSSSAFGPQSPAILRGTPSPNPDLISGHCQQDFHTQQHLNPMEHQYMGHNHHHHYYPDPMSRHSSPYFNFYQYQGGYPEHQISPPRDYSPESESSQLSPVGQLQGHQALAGSVHHHDFHSHHYYPFSQYSTPGGTQAETGCSGASMLLDNPSQHLSSPAFSPPSGTSGLARFGGLTSNLSRTSSCLVMGDKKSRSIVGKLGSGSNKKERRRTQSINNAFASLRDCIPNVPCDTKLSKIKSLRLATSYIDYLMQMLNSENTTPSKIILLSLPIVTIVNLLRRDFKRKILLVVCWNLGKQLKSEERTAFKINPVITISNAKST